MSEPQILCRMCDNSVNKAVHGLAAILLVRLVGQPPKNVKNEICPHRCFAFYTRTARLNVKSPYKRGRTGTGKRQFRSLPTNKMATKNKNRLVHPVLPLSMHPEEQNMFINLC